MVKRMCRLRRSQQGRLGVDCGFYLGAPTQCLEDSTCSTQLSWLEQHQEIHKLQSYRGAPEDEPYPLKPFLLPSEVLHMPLLLYVGFRKDGLIPNSDVSSAMDQGPDMVPPTLGGKKTAPRLEMQLSSTVFA